MWEIEAVLEARCLGVAVALSEGTSDVMLMPDPSREEDVVGLAYGLMVGVCDSLPR